MKINWDSLPSIGGIKKGLARKSICGEKISAAKITTTPDAVFDRKTHWHENEQILIMVSGTISLLIDDEEFDCGPGDMTFFPPGSRHAVIGVGKEGAVYYELFAPARPDQLPGWVGPSVLRFDNK